jgi:RNA polymerase sigma-70 factor (ECF subfamily)
MITAVQDPPSNVFDQAVSPDLTRLSLLERVRDVQDGDSWGEFVELYEPLLLNYLRCRGLSAADAADVAQEVFIVLLRTLPEFTLDRRRGRFRSWLWHVTRNALIDFVRRRQSRDRAEDGWRQAAALSGDEPDAAWRAAHRQRVLQYVLPKVRARTQPRTWYCFEEHLLAHRPCAEVAAELQLTANAVSANANRVLQRVRALCAEYQEDFDDR